MALNLEFASKRVIVTGASRGIGKVVARQFAEEGALVVIAARRATALRSAAKELAEATAGRVEPVVADTRSDESVSDLVRATVDRFGGVDILVNNAAIPGGAGGLTSSIAAERRDVADDFDGKVLGYLRCAQAVAPHVIRQGGGTSSTSAGCRPAKPLLCRRRSVTSGLQAVQEPGRRAWSPWHQRQHDPPGASRTEALEERLAQSGGERDATEALAGMASRVSLGRIVEAREVAWVVAFLSSPRSLAVNGNVIDCGGGTLGPIYY